MDMGADATECDASRHGYGVIEETAIDGSKYKFIYANRYKN